MKPGGHRGGHISIWENVAGLCGRTFMLSHLPLSTLVEWREGACFLIQNFSQKVLMEK